MYNRENIHLIDDEQSVFTIDDQLLFEMLLLEIRGKSISYASFKKKENTRLENEILFDIKQLEENLTENNLKVLEHKREELFELR